jgi:hypothetical protein
MLKVISFTSNDGKTDGIQAGKKKWLAVLENLGEIREFCEVAEPIPDSEVPF